MQENGRKKMLLLNVIVSVLFVLLFIAHLALRGHMQEWYNKFEVFWPNVDIILVRPLLAFTTGYALFSSLFSLLKAKLEIAGLRRWNLLRIVMLAITAFVVVAMLITVAVVFGELDFPSHKLMMFFAGVAHAEWLWLMLGIYWFLSLNALRVTEFEPLDDEDLDEDFDDDLDDYDDFDKD